jgi:hypothetical protein
VCGSRRFALDLGKRCEYGDLSSASSSSGKGRSRLNLARAEAITCCGWRETHERGDRVHCRREESNPSRATDPVAFAECSPLNVAELRSKLCVNGLALGNEFAINNAADVEKHNECGTYTVGGARGSVDG